MVSENKYTCNEYREEMTLLGLKRRLEDPSLSEAKREEIIAEIKRLEAAMGMN
jgi:hypothetical protein